MSREPNATNRYLDRLAALYGLPSDYAIANFLGVTRQHVSQWRRGIAQFSEGQAFTVATKLDIDPVEIIAAIGAERSKDAIAKEGWREIFRRVTSHAQPIAIFGAAILATAVGHDVAPIMRADAENKAFLQSPALSAQAEWLNIMLSPAAAEPAPTATGITPFDALAMAVALALAVFVRQRQPARLRGAHAST